MLTKRLNIWKKNKFNIACVLLILVLSLLICRLFFHQGFFPTHDGEWAVVRLGAMHRALLGRHFPVRWAGNLNFSYGYPLFMYTYPIPYYLGEVLNLLGFGLVGSIKILFVISVIFSGLAMFYLAKEIFKSRLGGLTAAVFYVWAPFRLVDLYVRGSLGECLAFVFYPLIFLLVWKISRQSRRFIPWLGLFYGGLLLTHNVSALLITPFLGIFGIWLILNMAKEKRLIAAGDITVGVLLGIGISAFFLLPALVEKKLIALSIIPIADKAKHFAGWKQLIIPSWGFDSPGSLKPFSFQLGPVHLMSLIIGLVLWLNRKKHQLTDRLFILLLTAVLIIVLMMLPVSLSVWENLPLFKEIDFPWRFLGPMVLFLGLAAGYLATHKLASRLIPMLILIVVVLNIKYIQTAGTIDNPDIYYLTNEATTTSNDELMPIWVKEKPVQRPVSRVEVIAGSGEVSQITDKGTKIQFNIDVKTEMKMQINTIYFPGWQVKVNGQVVPIEYDNPKGVMQINLTPGRQMILAELKETPARRIADLISFLSFGTTILLLIKYWREKTNS